MLKKCNGVIESCNLFEIIENEQGCCKISKK